MSSLEGTVKRPEGGVVLAPMSQAMGMLPAGVSLPEGALATAAGNADPLLLYVPAGVRIPQPLQLVNKLQRGRADADISALTIVLGKDASAKLLVCQHTVGDVVADTKAVNDNKVEIFLAEGASFDYYDLEETSEDTVRHSLVSVHQQAGSKALLDILTLYNGDTHNECRCEFLGEGAELKLYGMAICDRQRRLRFDTHIDHLVPHCHSDELYKISASDRADCSFCGLIKVHEGAVGTEAYQSSRNLLDGTDARIQARPELEIYNDDVKCNHGCAIGQLDPMEVFYMRTRGIPEHQARLLLRQAFMADVIDAITIPALNQRLRLLVERRFAGDSDAACGACSH